MRKNDFDVVIVGAGHAGCEAAFASARLDCRVLITTIDKNNIAFLACNPSIGGTAKGHLVCEIDALDGVMGVNADRTALQIKMLNVGKGSAVLSLRAQADKVRYHEEMEKMLNSHPNITVRECEVVAINSIQNAIQGTIQDATKNTMQDEIQNTTQNTTQTTIQNNKSNNAKITNQVKSVTLSSGEIITCSSVVIASGVYLNSKILIGDIVKQSGPSGFAGSYNLTDSLVKLGVEIRRFKTGTPPRVEKNSINYDKTEIQLGDDDIQSFSYLTTTPIKNVLPCYLTYTNPATHDIISRNIKRSAMYSGAVKGVGTRYCPSIEDKIVRFPSRDRHQVFLEPESLSSNEIYLQGLSSSLPSDAQHDFVHSINGLERAEILRDAYAIEYDTINSLQLFATLEHKCCSGLFFAGQVNGTSGYEEAAAQGLIAGANAGLFAKKGIANFTLSRTNSYIGVLIDDLVTVGTPEPYRMFTSRAEHRLYLRQENADLRLTKIGREIGLVSNNRWSVFIKRKQQIEKLRKIVETPIPFAQVESIFKKLDEPCAIGKMTIAQMTKRNNITLRALANEIEALKNFTPRILDLVTNEIKYEGYLAREQIKIAHAQTAEKMPIPDALDYNKINGLRREAQIKLGTVNPRNIGQASRISGVTPADINVLLVYLKHKSK